MSRKGNATVMHGSGPRTAGASCRHYWRWAGVGSAFRVMAIAVGCWLFQTPATAQEGTQAKGASDSAVSAPALAKPAPEPAPAKQPPRPIRGERLVKLLKGKLLRPATDTIRLRPPYPTFTAERESAALKFADQHINELVPVLHSLREMDRRQYQEVIRQIFGVSERITQTAERDPEEADLLLRDWRTATLIDLAYAHLAAEPSKEATARLKELLRERATLEQDRLTLLQERMTRRLQEVQAQLADFEAHGDQAIDEAHRQLTESAQRLRGESRLAAPTKPARPDNAPAVKTAPKKKESE